MYIIKVFLTFMLMDKYVFTLRLMLDQETFNFKSESKIENDVKIKQTFIENYPNLFHTKTELKTESTDKRRPNGFDQTRRKINRDDCCCGTQETFKIVKELTTVHGTVKQIVNFKGAYQVIPWATCLNWGSCLNCRLMKRTISLLAWTEVGTGKTPMFDLFSVPMYCSC